MNVLYCGDANIADGVLISVMSLLENASEPLHIYLLTANVCDNEINISALGKGFAIFLENIVKRKCAENTVELIDVTNEFLKELPVANMQTRFTPCCMLRLYCDKINLPDKILYLDNDVICCRNPKEFYSQDMQNYEIAGVLDYYGSHIFRKHFLHRDYLNSGVLLLNLKKIRETKSFEKCRLMCKTKKMFMPDQSAINKLCRYKKICDRRYNEQRKLHGNTVFRHFTTTFRLLPYFHTVKVKPWDIERMHKVLKLYEFDNLLNEFLKTKKEKQNYEQTNSDFLFN